MPLGVRWQARQEVTLLASTARAAALYQRWVCVAVRQVVSLLATTARTAVLDLVDDDG